jgi:hypothetical protein
MGFQQKLAVPIFFQLSLLYYIFTDLIRLHLSTLKLRLAKKNEKIDFTIYGFKVRFEKSSF